MSSSPHASFPRDPHPVVRAAPPLSLDFPPEPGWVPARLAAGADGAPVVDWIWMGRERFSEAFYALDLRRARRMSHERVLRTPLAQLAAWSERLPGARLSGLIFHMSRCGSTLAARVLAAAPDHIVASEPPPVDQVVRGHLAGLDRVRVLRAVAGALGLVRNPAERRLFLKLDCWHIRELALFRAAFPGAPWVFLYRDPIEVLVSHVRAGGVQMVPEFVPPGTYGLNLPDAVPTLGYFAAVLATLCEAAAQGCTGGGGLLVNYRDLPDALFTQVLPHFGAAPGPEARAAMHAAAARDAKGHVETFTPDARAKHAAADDAVRAACEGRLRSAYDRLEALRTATQTALPHRVGDRGAG